MRCLFFHGPTLDGDVPSKAGRGDLVDLGYCDRWNGWNWLTEAGVKFAVDSLLLEGQKERWKRERSEGVHRLRHPEEHTERLVAALKEAERFMAYFAGETGNVFVGPGTPTSCLRQIRTALQS